MSAVNVFFRSWVGLAEVLGGWVSLVPFVTLAIVFILWVSVYED